MGGRKKGKNQEKIKIKEHWIGDMAQSIEEFLLETIEKDDVKAFDALMEQTKCGGYRMGRFPVLSMLYLYKARRILSAYEENFLKITSWEEIKEPASVAKKFSEKAGKCLRLYLSEVVSPLEMLLILDKTRKLKRVYPLTKASAGIKERLQTIYKVKYSLEIKYEGNDIILDRRPLTRGEKKKIATICLCSFLAVAVAVATPVTVLTLNPPLAEGEVNKLKQISFASSKTYTLKKDITIPENYSVGEMNCTIVGNGKKLIFKRGAKIDKLNGNISDAEISTLGTPLFNTVTERAKLSNVTVNVTADTSVKESSAFIALTNYGVLEEVTLNVSGKVTAVTEETEVTFGGMVLNNSVKYNAFSQAYYGRIDNCTVNYTDFTLKGEVYANGAFGGIAGTNSGAILESKVTGSITADTFDLAGICSVNNYVISEAVNEANLYQTSANDGWNPIVCGIAIENKSLVEYSENRGALSAYSTCGEVEKMPSVSVAGIAYINRGGVLYISGIPYSVGIQFCQNSGAITAEGRGDVYAGGISSHSFNQIVYCMTSGEITVKADSVCAGGIFGRGDIEGESLYSVNWGHAEYCISESKLDITATGERSYVGGIAGFVTQGSVVDVPKEDGSKEILGYFGGGVTNCYFLGSCKNEITYFGNIVGVSGANILYGTDIYPLFAEYINYENNYHLNNSLPSFGASVALNGDEEDDEEEGVYEPATDVKANALTREEIESMEEYQEILKKLIQ